MNLMLVLSLIYGQLQHRKDLRDSADGIAKFYREIHEQAFRHGEYQQKQLREELEKAHTRLLNVKLRTPAQIQARPYVAAPDRQASRATPSANGNGQRDHDYATSVVK